MTRHYDAVIVGGGIHGVGFAQAAAAAGHTVLLLEQTALAHGSSSRSSKLIHGGLRYLESGQLRLVRESLHERALLLKLAPDLVHLRRFLIPVYRQTRRRPWQLRIGLSLYAMLAGPGSAALFGTLARRHWHELDGLRQQELQAVYWYHDAQTDDAMLTAAVMRSAQSLGAELLMPARFSGATLDRDTVAVRYTHGLQQCECRASVLINAAGPWAAQVAGLIAPTISVPPLELVQGTHIVLDGQLHQGVYYVESPRDGRAVFFMPWQSRTLVGTTELPFRGDPGGVQPTPHELKYLESVVRHYFPGRLQAGHQRRYEAFAGLRVLPAGGGHAFHRSRETLLSPDRELRPRVLSIYGGKLTTWRAISARALAVVAGSLPTRRPVARTDRLPLQAV
jgi:glycerol-3-phosphate dehydrogenase